MDVENFKIVTGRLYWQPSADPLGYIDFGNLPVCKDDPQIDRVPHWRCEGGRRKVDLLASKTGTNKKTFTLDEHFNETIKLLGHAQQLADVVQNAGVGLVVPIAAADLKVNRSYYLNRVSLKNVSGLALIGPLLVAGVDYVLDAVAGMVTVISSAKFGDDWEFTFDCDAATQLNFTRLSALLSQGTFRYFEYDANESVPFSSETFFGQVHVTGWGEGNNDQFNQFTIEVIYAL